MREFFAETIFWLHFVIVGFWYFVVLIPIPGWEGRIVFQFYLTLGIVGHQFIWGLLLLPWSKRYGSVCILTTFMQLLRGEKLSDERNYRHSWTREFFQRVGRGLPQRGATILTFVILGISVAQYILFR